IPVLVESFVRAAGVAGEIAGPNLDRLVGHGWPGNVRELRNTIERAVALADSRTACFRDLPVALGEQSPTLAWPIHLDSPFKEAKDHLNAAFERVYLSRLLDLVGGNVAEAARRAGLSRRHFFEMIKKHGLRAGSQPDEG